MIILLFGHFCNRKTAIYFILEIFSKQKNPEDANPRDDLLVMCYHHKHRKVVKNASCNGEQMPY